MSVALLGKENSKGYSLKFSKARYKHANEEHVALPSDFHFSALETENAQLTKCFVPAGCIDVQGVQNTELIRKYTMQQAFIIQPPPLQFGDKLLTDKH